MTRLLDRRGLSREISKLIFDYYEGYTIKKITRFQDTEYIEYISLTPFQTHLPISLFHPPGSSWRVQRLFESEWIWEFLGHIDTTMVVITNQWLEGYWEVSCYACC